MKNILVYNDNSAAATHAAEFALYIAQKMGANIILANTFKKTRSPVEKVTAGNGDKNYYPPLEEATLNALLLRNLAIEYKTHVEIVDFGNTGTDLADFINKNNIWLTVKGNGNTATADCRVQPVNAHLILNKVQCPLLLVPESWQIKTIEQIAYIADLRYCRIHVVRFLAELARPWRAFLSIAQLTAKGLPEMQENYARNIFNGEICPNVNYKRLLFDHIKEKDFATVVDVLVNGMHNDILVLVNHHFHLEEILGPHSGDKLAGHIGIPLLIFPY
ncbi:universal stress protein [Mucilaginibacter gotjawali]|uniref:Nucleotide-binding universal stress UspA family protein n=1 Tax=Mucilaginibacter gotjawali TaxID=1550579 RepID=A0A839SEY4_9SPHI|nr:universal stress protein [Mucilaginibacter gotjawali]MBB3056366.1 nucleotide-binding universal stress UspA family protein [Mucilaginibacter gotjawali]